MQHLFLIGNLSKDVELKYTKDGTAYANFSVADNYTYKTKSGEKKKETSFFDVTVFGKLAENCAEYLSKGKQVAIAGRLKQNTWETSDGSKRSKVVIIATEVKFLTPKGGTSNASVDQAAISDDDIPF